MHRGNQTKGPNGRIGNWPTPGNVPNNGRSNPPSFVQHYSLNQQPHQSQSYLLNGLNGENYSVDSSLMSIQDPNSILQTLSQAPESRKEDFPALSLNRNSSAQSSQKNVQSSQADPKRPNSSSKGSNATTLASGNPETNSTPTKILRNPRAPQDSEQQSYATKASSLSKKQEQLLEDHQKDKFGLPSLVASLKGDCPAVDTQLMFGTPLEKLNLKLEDPSRKLFNEFGSPWEKESVAFQGISKEPEWSMPQVYNIAIPPNLITKIGKLADTTLLYIFYSMPKNTYQDLASQELYNRNWRFHKERQLWITNSKETSKAKASEREELYEVFHPRSWEFKTEKLVVLPEELELRSVVNLQALNMNHHPSVPQAIPPHVNLAASYLQSNNPPLQHPQSVNQHSHQSQTHQQSMYMYKQQQVPLQYNQQHPSGLAGLPNHGGPQHLAGPSQQHPLQMHLQPPPLSAQQSHLHSTLAGMNVHHNLGPPLPPNHIHPGLYNNGLHYGPSSSVPGGLTGMGLPAGYSLTGSGPNMGLPPQHGVSRMKDY